MTDLSDSKIENIAFSIAKTAIKLYPKNAEQSIENWVWDYVQDDKASSKLKRDFGNKDVFDRGVNRAIAEYNKKSVDKMST